MHVTLLLPGLLVPAEIAPDLAQALDAPALASRMARSSPVGKHHVPGDAANAPHLDWLAREVFHSDPPATTAPYAYAEISQQPAPTDFLWHADPIHVELGREHLFVQTVPTAPSDADADVLIAAANEIFVDMDAELLRVGAHWFMQTRHDWRLHTVPLAAAADQRLDSVLPTGADAQRWLRAHNALQMSWHAHAINGDRERRGEPTINGVWLHGGGKWQPLPKTRFSQVVARDAALRGAAVAASADASSDLAAPQRDGALLVWDDAYASRRREDWGGWLAAVAIIGQRATALASSTIDIVLTGRATLRTLQARRADAARFWQRASLASLLAEPR